MTTAMVSPLLARSRYLPGWLVWRHGFMDRDRIGNCALIKHRCCYQKKLFGINNDWLGTIFQWLWSIWFNWYLPPLLITSNAPRNAALTWIRNGINNGSYLEPFGSIQGWYRMILMVDHNDFLRAVPGCIPIWPSSVCACKGTGGCTHNLWTSLCMIDGWLVGVCYPCCCVKNRQLILSSSSFAAIGMSPPSCHYI